MKDIKNIIIAIIVLSVIIIGFWLWVKPKKKPSVIPAINKQLEEIAQKKMQDLNANSIEAAKKIIAGTARSMGIEIEK